MDRLGCRKRHRYILGNGQLNASRDVDVPVLLAMLYTGNDLGVPARTSTALDLTRVEKVPRRREDAKS